MLSGFIWGVATSATQIEGEAHGAGKTDSIWDVFCRAPCAVADGATPEIACDHYRRMPEDVALLRDLGVSAYRFSVNWSRVKPDDGAVNRAAVDFYSRLVDALLDAAIEPWLTLYHWDLPQTVEDAGGWPSRDTAARFRDYATIVHAALGDRVNRWTTFNEHFCSAMLGYADGVHAPGRTDPQAAIAAVHHQHLAHGLAVDALRAAGAKHVGITLNLGAAISATADRADIEAAQRCDLRQNRLFLDPLLRGRYPDLAWEEYGHALDGVVWDGDLGLISRPLDFLGVNYYRDERVSARLGVVPRALPRTAMGWEVDPDGLRRLLVRLRVEYPALPPVYITENGAAFDDVVGEDGVVHDPERTRYILDHIGAVEAAIAEGVDVRGYFVWSLLDNFEWAYGYSKRFGIVRVDFDSQTRTLKDSARAYAERIRRP